MKIHLKQIPAQGLHLDGDEGCPIHDLEAEGIRCAGQLHYNIDVGIAGGALWARGSLSQPVELSCVSCLEKFVHEIRSARICRAHGAAWPGDGRPHAVYTRGSLA